MKSTTHLVSALRAKDQAASAASIAEAIGVSRERVRQILVNLGLPTRVVSGKIGTDRRVEYKCWKNMIARCVDPRCETFKYYGARGISVCKRWLTSFDNFYADMGPRPAPNLSLDRKDNDGNYEPRNCRWATKAQQTKSSRPPVCKPKTGMMPLRQMAKIINESPTMHVALETINAAGYEPVTRVWLYRAKANGKLKIKKRRGNTGAKLSR